MDSVQKASPPSPASNPRALAWLPGGVALLLALLLLLCLSQSKAALLSLRLPGTDDPENRRQADLAFRLPQGELQSGSGTPSQIMAMWPQFRGPERDAISIESVPLARAWPEGGPPVLWSRELGEGYAAAAVRHGRVYVFDYDMAQKRDTLRCLSLDDGAEIWNYSYPLAAKRNHGVSRTVPAVGEKHILALGPRCHVICNDALSGELKWMIDLRQTYGTPEPLWYAGQCPLLDGETAILAPGGPEALLVAIDCESGRELWRTPNPDNWKMSHSSIMPMTRNGVKTYVYAALGGVLGVDARDGRVLWKTDAFTMHTVSPSPVQLSEDRILLTAGYGKGGALLELTDTPGGTEARLIKSTTPREFATEQQTPILYNGYIYAVLPKPRQDLVCVDMNLNHVWSSGPTNIFGLGPYIVAGGLLFLLDDFGKLTLAEATPEGYRQLAQAQVLQGKDSWGPLALVEGRLLLRDTERMICLDVSRRD